MNYYTRVYIIGLGFLSGLFIGIGVDPDGEIVKALIDILATYSPALAILLRIICITIGIISMIQSWASAYRRGGRIGIFAVGLAFLGGILIGLGYGVGIWLVIVAIIVAILIGMFLLK